MKELTIQEKASRYDKAIEKAKKHYEECKMCGNDWFVENMKDMFPELVESDDEKIRKALLNEFIHLQSKGCKFAGLEGEEIVDWLEKQGNQKLTKKIIFKFHEGDWCIDNEDGTIFQIVKILDNTYTYKTNEDKEYSCTHYSLENDARLWTIKDAKDGDILCSKSGWTCIFKALDNHTNTFSSYCFMDSDNWFCNTGSECHTFNEQFIKAYNWEPHPAKKEQCDLLFQKMREENYEWDAEKKELKKIELIFKS